MAISLLVALRATETVARPLRRASEAANQLANANDRMSTQIKAAGNAMIGLSAIAAATFAIVSKEAADLEQAVARLATVTRSTTGTQETALRDAEEAARSFATQYSASAEEVIRAQFQIATAGVPVNEQLEATQASFKLARATMGEFTQSAQVLGSFLNTFGRNAEFNYLAPAEKMEAITDRLSTSVQRFQVTLPVLAESFKFIVGPASQLNLRLSETAAAIGVLNTAGFRGTLAGTALSNMFNKLDRAVEKLNLNPDQFIDLNGNLESLVAFLGEVNRSLEGMTSIEQQNKLIEVFDIRAGRVIKTLLNMEHQIARLSAELDVSVGATQAMADTVERTTGKSFKQFLNSLDNIITRFGAVINIGLKPFVIFLNNAAVGFEKFVSNFGPLLPALVGVTVAVGAFSTAIFVGTFAVTKLGGAVAALTAFFGAGTVAATAFTVAVSAISIVGIVGVVGALAGSLYAVANAFMAADDAAGSASFDQVQRRFGNTVQEIARATNETERLGRALEANVIEPISTAGARQGIDNLFGDSDFAKDVLKVFRANQNLAESVRLVSDDYGGFLGVAKSVVSSLRATEEQVEQAANAFVMMRSIGDKAFAGLDEPLKAADFGRAAIEAGNTAILQIARGSEEAATAIGELAANSKRLFETIGNQEARAKILEKIAETIQTNADALRSVDSEPIQRLIRSFDELGEGFTDDNFFNLSAFNLNALNDDISQLLLRALELQEPFKAINTAISQSRTAIKSVDNILGEASLGGAKFSEALATSAERIDDIERGINAIDQLSGILNDKFDKLGSQFKDTPLFGAIEQLQGELQAVRVDLLGGQSEAIIKRDAQKIGAIVETELGDKLRSATFRETFESISKGLSDAVGESILTGFEKSGTTAPQRLRQAFRRDFIQGIQGDIGQLLGTSFAEPLQQALDVARQEIRRLQTSGELSDLFNANRLGDHLNTVVQDSVAGISKLGISDLFAPDKPFEDKLSKLAETFRDVSVDAGVAAITAGARSAAFLERLQRITSEGPAQSIAELNNQADRLRSLLREAHQTGADGAVNLIENALKGTLEQLAGGGPAATAASIAQSIERGSNSLNTVTNTFASVVDRLVPAGAQMVDLLKSGFDDIFNKANSEIIEKGRQSNRQFVIDLNAGRSNITVDVDIESIRGAGSDDRLDEFEIRKIIDEVKDEMILDMDEKLRRLEEELRGR